MKLSVVYSIFNRTKLFDKGLKSLICQTMPREEFEIVVVDDGSTEDIKSFLKDYSNIFSIKYIRINSANHPNYCGYHTQALSANIGIKKAQGDVICISQPEIIHAPSNLLLGWDIAFNKNRQVFAEIIMASQEFNSWLDRNNWQSSSYDELIDRVDSFKREYDFNHMPDNGFYELYWFVQFFQKAAALEIGGVDEEYLRGVYAEDDNFKARLRMNGIEETYAGRPRLIGITDNYIVGIHQSHKYEGDLYNKQNRNSKFWDDGAHKNRERWQHWCLNPVTVANENKSWGSDEYIIEEIQI